ncbi:MAG: TRM11 family SAM-dependent methyltransferase [Fimbriimonadales bacterium]
MSGRTRGRQDETLPLEPIPMREVRWEEYEAYRQSHAQVIIEETPIPLTGLKLIDRVQPDSFVPESTTVWSFPDRGDWATHRGNYRGNWAPQIPRNLILRYTQPNEWVLDPMVGSGTTLIECRLLGRNGIGVDVNAQALMLTFDRLNFRPKDLYQELPETTVRLYHGDARRLDAIPDDSIDLIVTHPPYAGIIHYTKSAPVAGDLSRLRSLTLFLDQMECVASECYRVLKPGRHCAILIGDTRKHKHYVPVAHYTLDRFLRAGFILRENIVKVQHNMKSTRERWSFGRERDFYLIYHENLFVFRKPSTEESIRRYADSLQELPALR